MINNKLLEENLTSRLFAVQKVYAFVMQLEESDIKNLMLENVPNCGMPKNATVNKVFKTVLENEVYLKDVIGKYDVKDFMVSAILMCGLAEIIYLKKDLKIIVSQYQKLASFYYEDGAVKQITKVLNTEGKDL